jgi:myo-inositol-1(or 4)-monophosphatase
MKPLELARQTRSPLADRFGESSELLELAVEAADKAGKLQLAGFGRPMKLWEKAPRTYVTDFDVRSEELIYRHLSRVPGVGFIGEERDEREGRRGGVTWVVDPLDGTANFLRGYPSFAVSIALVDGGDPRLSVVHVPLSGATYVAVRGQGAWLGTKRLRVAARRRSAAICATGVPRAFDERARYARTLARLLPEIDDIRRVSPVSLDLAYVAGGALDGCFERELGPWDIAGGALLVREAGGTVTDWDGNPRAWWHNGAVLAAATPELHDTLLMAAGTAQRD